MKTQLKPQYIAIALVLVAGARTLRDVKMELPKVCEAEHVSEAEIYQLCVELHSAQKAALKDMRR